jgi:hypothetical protein
MIKIISERLQILFHRKNGIQKENVEMAMITTVA